MSWSSAEVSVVAHAHETQTKSYTLTKLLGAIKGGKWASQITALRALADKDAIREAKEKLPGIMFSGRFSERTKPVLNFLEQSSGILALDADNCTSPVELRNKLTSDPYVVFAFISPYGLGLKVGVRIEGNADSHKASWAAAKKYFQETYNVTIDGACKDISRLCFVSYDPDMFIREGEAEILEPLEEPPAQPLVFDDGDIQARVGPPFWRDQQGNISKMNWQYFGDRFCAENLVIFEQDEGAFFIYREATGSWHKVVPDIIKEMIRKDYQHLTREFAEPIMEQKISNTVYNAIVNAVQSGAGRTEVFKPLKRVIHCANTMLHLESVEASEILHTSTEGNVIRECEFSPDYYSRNPTTIAWNPEATCPKFQAILDTMAPDDADLILRYAANVLLGGNPSQQILLLTGMGGTSKSTMCALIELVAGRRNFAELRTEHLDNRFEIGRYVGKTLLTGKDVKGTFLQSEGASRIKALTGHDMLTGEIKLSMGTPEIFGNFAVIITCNEKLIVRLEGETDMSAWARRLLLINFTEKSVHKEIIVDYDEKLFAEEGEGILVLIVKAAFRHLKELDEIGTFTQTPAQRGRVEALLAESRSIELFVRDRVYKDAGSDISSDEMTTAYNEFCEDRGWNPVKLGVLQRELPGLMAKCHQSNLGSHCMRPDSHGVERRARGYPKVALLEAADYAETTP